MVCCRVLSTSEIVPYHPHLVVICTKPECGKRINTINEAITHYGEHPDGIKLFRCQKKGCNFIVFREADYRGHSHDPGWVRRWEDTIDVSLMCHHVVKISDSQRRHVHWLTHLWYTYIYNQHTVMSTQSPIFRVYIYVLERLGISSSVSEFLRERACPPIWDLYRVQYQTHVTWSMLIKRGQSSQQTYWSAGD